MWTQCSSTDISININNLECHWFIGFEPTVPDEHDLDEIKLVRDRHCHELSFQVRGRSRQSLEQIMNLFAPEHLHTNLVVNSEFYKIEFTSPDKKVIATVMNGLKRRYPELQDIFVTICERANISLDECCDPLPHWILIKRSNTGFKMMNTRDEVIRTITVNLSHGNLWISYNGAAENEERSFPDINAAGLLAVFQSIKEKNVTTDQEILSEILMRTGFLVSPTHVLNIFREFFSDSEDQPSTTPLLTSFTRETEEKDWADEFKRLKYLSSGVFTEASKKKLQSLTQKMTQRLKTNDYYSSWLKNNHGEIKNSDDLIYVAKTERFYELFIKSNSRTFKIVLIYMMKDYLLGITDFQPYKILHNDLDEVETLRRTLKSKRKYNEEIVDVALLILAKYFPINEEDSATLERIEEANRVFVTEGHQHDIYSLIQWNLSRPLLESESTNESGNFKHLLNPFTNEIVPPINVGYIIEMGKAHPLLKDLNLQTNQNRLKDLLKDFQIFDRLFNNPIAVMPNDRDAIEFKRRLCRLDEDDEKRIVAKIHNFRHDMYFVLKNLLKHSLSLESFARLDDERQNVLLAGKMFEHILGYGIDPDKLIALSPEHLKEIDKLVYDLDDELPETVPPYYRVSESNLAMINNEIDKRLELQGKNSLSCGFN